jgi:hypothetical protein
MCTVEGVLECTGDDQEGVHTVGNGGGGGIAGSYSNYSCYKTTQREYTGAVSRVYTEVDFWNSAEDRISLYFSGIPEPNSTEFRKKYQYHIEIN